MKKKPEGRSEKHAIVHEDDFVVIQNIYTLKKIKIQIKNNNEKKT